MSELAELSIRDKVFILEAQMLQMEGQVEFPVKHYFSQGVYARELFIPKGMIVIGAIHKFTQLNIMSQGDISVLTEDGMKRVQAPFTVVSPPGTKRIAYTHEDTTWTTIHGTDEVDVAKIEARFIAKTEEEYIAFCKTEGAKWLG